MGNFGTLVNGSVFAEVPDPLNPGQTRRPDAGAVVLLARDHLTGVTLDPITTTDFGYWSASYPGTDLLDVSADDGLTWVGPLMSDSGMEAAIAALAQVADLAAQVAALQDQIAAGGGGGGAGGPVAYADLPAGVMIDGRTATRPTSRTDLTVVFTDADPGNNALDGVDFIESP